MRRPTQVEILRRLYLAVYAPQMASSIGVGMLVPVLPLYLTEKGLGFREAAVVLAAAGFGGAVGSLPAGGVVARFGVRTLRIVALVSMAAASAVMGSTSFVPALVGFHVAVGAGAAAHRLANQTHITRSVDGPMRGRAMSLMGGTYRLAYLIGPLLGGLMVDMVGFRATFVAIGAVVAVGLIPSLLYQEGATATARISRPGLWPALKRHKRLLVRSGVGPALVMAVRSGRTVVVPLIGDQLGLSPTAVGGLVAVGTGADLLLFPVSGLVMDRHGRLAAMVPAFGLLGLGLLMLSMADGTAMVVVAGVVMGVGNGMSAGTMLTLSSDLAPAEEQGPFLAAMAAMQDSGRVAGPLLVGWFAAAAGLDTSALVLAVAMFAGIAWIVVVVGETAPHRQGQAVPRAD